MDLGRGSRVVVVVIGIAVATSGCRLYAWGGNAALANSVSAPPAPQALYPRRRQSVAPPTGASVERGTVLQLWGS